MLRRLPLSLATASCALLLQGCALQQPLDEFLDSPGTRTPSARTALPGTGIEPAAVYRGATPAIVTVISDFGDKTDSVIGIGTGFAIGDRRTIVTNAHVVLNELDNHRKAYAVTLQIEDGSRVPAEIAGIDPHADVAVLTSEKPITKRALRFARREPRVGDPVVAIGSPLGETYTLSAGYVSGVDRAIQGLAGFPIYGAIQTDAVITMGNSGGPLLNADGEVIGVNGQVLSVGGGGEGLGFAIPADLVARSARFLAEDKTVPYAYLGVRGKPVWRGLYDELSTFDFSKEADWEFAGESAGKLMPNRPGVLVGEVRENSPADIAGLRGSDKSFNIHGSEVSLGGDVITRLGSHDLVYNEQLGEALMRFRPGQSLTISYYRDGEFRRTTVELENRPLLWPSLWKSLFG